MTEEQMILQVCRVFQLRGEYRSYETITYGHINTTYKVYFFRDGEIKDYILQRVNTYVFRNPVEVMENTIAVTEYIRNKIKKTGVSAKRSVLHYQKTAAGEYYTIAEDGGFWRCCRFIDDSVTFLNAESAKVMEEAGKAFGEFQKYLADYPVEKLHIAIPHFHNTVMRYETFRKSVEADVCHRAAEVKPEIDQYFRLEELATKMYKMQRRGELPLRVTHNDTKCSNILFDKDSLTHLSVIDLDTVMPGLVAFDFGDAIRSGANTGAEDERDIKKSLRRHGEIRSVYQRFRRYRAGGPYAKGKRVDGAGCPDDDRGMRYALSHRLSRRRQVFQDSLSRSELCPREMSSCTGGRYDRSYGRHGRNRRQVLQGLSPFSFC